MSDYDFQYEGSARVTDHTVDIAAYFGRMKLMAGLVGTGFIVFILYDVLAPGEGYSIFSKELGHYGLGYVWGENEWWANSYSRCITEEIRSRGCTSETTPMEYLQSVMRRNPMTYVWHFLFSVFLFGPTLLFIFQRRPAPIRFNSKLDAFYTWRNGRMFIHAGSKFEYTFKPIKDGLMGMTPRGPVKVSLTNARNPKRNRNIRIGPYAAQNPPQPMALIDQMRFFLQGRESVAETRMRPDRLTFPWWQRSIFGGRKLPADIDEHAEKWVAANVQKAENV